MSDWPFADRENTAAFTLRDIVDGGKPILRVTHDEDDGAWQFLDGRDNPDVKDAAVVSLKEILQRDSSVGELADLPLGWCAWRTDATSPWQREELGPEEDDAPESEN